MPDIAGIRVYKRGNTIMLCQNCGDDHMPPATAPGRRRFLGIAVAGLSLATSASLARAAETNAVPKPGNVLSPDAALHELMQGNERYVKGLTRRHDFRSERAALAGGQNPYATILSCSDSRVGPEFTFDSFRGDLFVVRVAGNFVNEDNLATFEYGVAVLNVPLLLVLGHSSCGAVASTIKSIDTNTTLPGHLPSLVSALAPAVKAAKGQAGDLQANATKANVRMMVERLKTATPILSKAVEDKKLRVVGGYYDLGSGAVDLIA
jgi:carbonic anhydrase